MPESFQSEPDRQSGSLSPDAVREKLIGLGENSVRKSYYPQLQEKIRALESKQQELMETVRNLEERETELERAIIEKNVLLREVHHRVKNNLQIIGSLLNLGSDTHETKRRIEAIATVYNLLLQEGHYADLDLRQLLRTVCDNLWLEFNRPDVIVTYELTSTELVVDMDRAVPFTLIVSELVNNALSHGCRDSGGTIRVGLAAAVRGDGEEAKNCLWVEDNGPGLAKNTSSGKEKLGLTLVDMLARQLKASWKLESGQAGQGVRVSLFFPDCC